MSNLPVVRLATRGSPLALVQAGLVAARLREVAIGLDVELVVVETSGDANLEVPLHAIGGRGVFQKEVDAAVADGRADAAVHSAKDLPVSVPGPGGDGAVLPIAAVLERADARDALVGTRLDGLGPGAVVATGSVRRRAQLAWLRPDLVFTELRGNIQTRLAKVPSGGAIVVAAAALDRLGLSDRAAQLLTTTELLPQVGQGAIAVTALPAADRPAGLSALLSAIDHDPSRRAVEAERAYLFGVGGGCDQPVGAYAVADRDGRLLLTAMMASADGHVLVRRSASGEDPAALGRVLADEVLDHGGRAIAAGVTAS